MLRLIALPAIATALVVALLVPGSASAAGNGCPPGFTVAIILDPGARPDRNGDGRVCIKGVQGANVGIDNNVPSGVASGVNDAGSSVLVDTATGDVLSG